MTSSGIVIVDKPSGMTSHDVVARMRRLAGTRRVGHAGTLDPMATGVLVIGMEKATRLLGHLMLTEKEYAATIRLGQSTTTDDAEGEIILAAAAAPVTATPTAETPVAATPTGEAPDAATGAVAAPDAATGTNATRAADIAPARLSAALAEFTGEILQVPPGISAIKVKGQRAYHLTRSGAAPELAARTVTVSRLELLAVRTSGDLLDIDVAVTCSSGTYIRAIARDLGVALGTGGHLTALRRTRVGPYQLSDARTLDQLAERLDFIPLAQAAAAAFRRRDLTEHEVRLISHGVRLPAIDVLAPETADVVSHGPVDDDLLTQTAHSADRAAGPIAAFGPDGTLIALLTEEDGQTRSLAVFVP
jgi:tRNA pseudouridine55 synthase